MPEGKISIGTSGWSYPHWENAFYHHQVKPKNQLSFYAKHFKSVELNSTFYRLPSEQAVQTWVDQVPKDFIFAAKASRFITHNKKLSDYTESPFNFLGRIQGLGNKLGPIVFQLPAFLKGNPERLELFIAHLPKGYRYSFELRNPTWFTDEIYSILKKYDVALCITDLGGQLTPLEITASFSYIRLHGPTKLYSGQYGAKRLQIWKEKIQGWAHQGLDIYCYFDNDEKGYAIIDALQLQSMLKG